MLKKYVHEPVPSKCADSTHWQDEKPNTRVLGKENPELTARFYWFAKKIGKKKPQNEFRGKPAREETYQLSMFGLLLLESYIVAVTLHLLALSLGLP